MTFAIRGAPYACGSGSRLPRHGAWAARVSWQITGTKGMEMNDIVAPSTSAPVPAWEQPLAVVIEPSTDLAEAIRDALAEVGFEVVLVATHVGAARASDGRCPQLLIACVPAHAEDTAGAYLEDCREMLGVLPTVLMMSDSEPGRQEGAPMDAVRVVKPFARAELLLAVDQALAIAASSLAD